MKMINFKWTSFLIVLLLVTASCSSIKAPRRGLVLMMMSNADAHVGMGSPEVNSGDHVQIIRDVCKPVGSGDRGTERCTREEVGHGTVTSVLNDKYSEVRFDSNTKAKVGDVIVKHAH